MNFFKINNYLKLERCKRIEIFPERVESFFEHTEPYQGPESTYKIIGKVWENVFNKFPTNIFELIYKKEIHKISKAYEDYHVNGISDGACAGKGLEKISKKIQYSRRNFSRLKSLAKHLELQHNNQNFFEKDNFILLNKIISKFHISDKLYEGQAWTWEIDNKKIHAEIFDHIYFADILLKLSDIYKWEDFTFLGDGSGILSSLLMNNQKKDANYKFIDIVHFLLKQFLTNFNETKTSFYLAENFSYENFPSSQVLVNQDSFPEINNQGLKNYFNLIKNSKIDYVASYNQELYVHSHTNFRKMLFESGMKSLIRFESTMRKDYFIEIFKKF